MDGRRYFTQSLPQSKRKKKNCRAGSDKSASLVHVERADSWLSHGSCEVDSDPEQMQVWHQEEIEFPFF